jgi:hypothetical protein
MTKCRVSQNFIRDSVDGLPGADGGGLLNIGTCTISHCAFVENKSGIATTDYVFGLFGPGGNGGAIANAGEMSIDDSMIQSNESGRGGGAIPRSGGIRLGPPPGAGALAAGREEESTIPVC